MTPIDVSESVIALRGWRRHLAAGAAGALTAAAMPSSSLLPVIFITFPILLWLMDGVLSVGIHRSLAARLRSGAAVGWWFGFGFFLAGLYWIGFAFVVDAEKFAWALPFAVTILPAGLALFVSAAMAAYVLLRPAGWGRPVALAVVWAVAEWLRGHILTGFPWNLIGAAWAPSEAMIQIVAVTGGYGLSFFTVLIATLPALFFERTSAVRRWAGPIAAALLVAAIWGSGAYRLAQATDQNVPGVKIRIVQPNIEQTEKWKRENRSAIFSRFIDLSATQGLQSVTHLVWPESALPFLLARQPEALRIIGELLPPRAHLLTGAIRLGSGSPAPLYNSVFVIDSDGEIINVYDKHHLVPFGEYLPLKPFFRLIGLTELTGDGYTPGPRVRTLSLPGAPPVSPLVCYEAIFPGAVAEREYRPGWLLNVTNDAWFGDSSGPRQHLHQARLRAVEEGIPLVRAANTGISSIMNPYGRILDSVDLNTEGFIDSPLPKALSPTIYARFGDWVFGGAISFALALVVLVSRNGRKKKQ